jgi:type IV pilus assembly protein PilQ
VPVLGDLPYLWALFKQARTHLQQAEMLVFITPKMMADRNAAR